MSVRDWFAAGLQLVTNQLSAMKLDQLKRFRRLLYSWFKFTRTGQVKVSYQATSIQKPVLDCLCPLRDCLLFTKDRLILVSIILAAAKTCGFSAGLVTGRSLQPAELKHLKKFGTFWKSLYHQESFTNKHFWCIGKTNWFDYMPYNIWCPDFCDGHWTEL